MDDARRTSLTTWGDQRAPGLIVRWRPARSPAGAARRHPCRHAERCADGQVRAGGGRGPMMCPLQVQNAVGLAAAPNGFAARAVKD